MNAAGIAEVTVKINALDQEINTNKEMLKQPGISENERVAIRNEIAAYIQRLTGLEAERRELRQQQQASAGKFLFAAICI